MIEVDENGEEFQNVVTYVPYNQKGYNFGNGIRTEKKDP